MKEILIILQILLSLLLVVIILIQSRGTGFGRGWGAAGASFSRRGLEKVVFKLTFIVTAAFIVVSVLQLSL